MDALVRLCGPSRFEYLSSCVGVMFSSFLWLARLSLDNRELLCLGKRLLMLLMACEEPPEEGGLSKIESRVLSPELPSRLCGLKFEDGVRTKGSGAGFLVFRVESNIPLS